jgi:hypothetical protein
MSSSLEFFGTWLGSKLQGPMTRGFEVNLGFTLAAIVTIPFTIPFTKKRGLYIDIMPVRIAMVAMAARVNPT